MNKIKIIILAVFMSGFIGTLLAQEAAIEASAKTEEDAKPKKSIRPQKETILLHAGIGFAYAPIIYENDNIGGQILDFEKRSGLSFELGATYFFNEKWGIASGLGLSGHRTALHLVGYSDTITGLTDSDDLGYTMYVTGNKMYEKQSVLMLDIPVMAQYNHKLIDGLALSAGAGFKLGIPVKKTYSLEECDITTQAYYPGLNFLLTDYAEMGMYENRTDWNPSGDMDVNLNVAFLLEAGVLYSLDDIIGIGAKGFLVYGLNKLSDGDKVYAIESPDTYNSLSTLGGSLKNVSVGIKLNFVFDYASYGKYAKIRGEKVVRLPGFLKGKEDKKDS